MLGKDPTLIVHSREPFNGGPPLLHLAEQFVTPVPLFFVRNHGSVPAINPATYRLRVTGHVKRPLELSLEEIRALPQSTVGAALQCAGNRRGEFMAVAPISGEIPWGAEAAGNARWTGVALREILTAAGVHEVAQHVAFLGLDDVERQRTGFGGSIPIHKALAPEVLLATEMNGAPLLPVHGFPLRVIVPGYIGARSVKWLSEITVQEEPSSNYFQAHAYKIFPPHVRAESADWSRGLMLGELPVNAVICDPADGTTVGADLTVRGYALTSGGRRVERVDLSVDRSDSWYTADLSAEEPWAWRLFSHHLNLQPGRHEIAVRAWDSAATTQPEDARNLWNFKGYMNNAWHRVRINVSG
jgi:sulfite oxidase